MTQILIGLVILFLTAFVLVGVVVALVAIAQNWAKIEKVFKKPSYKQDMAELRESLNFKTVKHEDIY